MNDKFTIVTWKGHEIDLSRGPAKEQVDIEDIAHHLSMQCRFVGACNRFYSIAEHCIYVALLAPKVQSVYFLLHDAHEYIYHDLTSPFKKFLETLLRDADAYRQLCFQTDKTIMSAFGLSHSGFLNMSANIKMIDNVVYTMERKYLFGRVNVNPSFPEDHPLHGAPFGMDQETAKKEFVQMFANLMG